MESHKYVLELQRSLPFCLFLHVHSCACASVSRPECLRKRVFWSAGACGPVLLRELKEDLAASVEGAVLKGGWRERERAKLLYREMDRTD